MPAVNTAKRHSYSLTFKLAVIKTAKASSNSSAARTHNSMRASYANGRETKPLSWLRKKLKCIVADAVLVLLEEVEP